MIHIKPYKIFESLEDETLYIFDFDDTIVNSPRFEEQIKDYLNEELTVSSLLNDVLLQINKKTSDLRYENGRYFIEDPNKEINTRGIDWVRKKERVYLIAPEKYYYSDLSFPTELTDIGEFYKSVKNKAIVTARYDKIKFKVEEYLESLGLDYPNYGLFCFPGYNNNNMNRTPEWKGKTVVKLINGNGFKRARFYDDTSKTVRIVRKIVSEELPDIDFKSIKVTGWWR